MTTIEKIKAEIQKALDAEGDSENARAQALALFWVLELIDKYAEQEPCDDAVSRQAVLEMAYDMSEIDGEHFTEPHMVVDVEDIQRLPFVTQKPIECDDVVSRQAMINLIRGCNSALEEPRIFNCHNAGVKFEQYVTELPPVRPQEQTGKWIGIDEEPHEVWECDHCGFVIDGSGCIDPYDYRDTYKFCPNCGAKMVEQRETETWHGIHAQITAPKGTFEQIFNESDDDYDI